jgi:NADH-ubiquinone oxidoreductase chain 6
MLELLGIFILMLLSVIICCNSNPMYSIFSFIGLIFFLSAYIIKHNVEFIAIAFLIIYIGAITVIFIFVVFLLNLYGLSTPNLNYAQYVTFKINLFYQGTVLLIIMFKIMFVYINISTEIKLVIIDFPIDPIYIYEEICIFAEMKLNLIYSYDINTIGYLLYVTYPIYLILCAFILFVAMCGSVLIIQNPIHNKN